MTKIREKRLSEPAGMANTQTLLATRIRVLSEGETVPEGAEVLPEADTSAAGDWQPVTPDKIGNITVPHE